MKQILFLVIIFFSVLLIGCQSEFITNDVPTSLEPVIECDALRPCPVGECYVFEGDSNAICYEGNPCEACESEECLIAESYPMQVFCS